MSDIIQKLEQILIARKGENEESSYVSSLYKKGDETILKKIVEEATEVVMATGENNKEQITHEVADLYFHILVLLAHKDIKIDEIYNELDRRFGTSGIVEKQNRNK